MSPQDVLQAYIVAEIAKGPDTRVESQNHSSAILVRGGRVNHPLHFLLGVFTCSLWWWVWLLLVLFNQPSRTLVVVDSAGQLLIQGL